MRPKVSNNVAYVVKKIGEIRKEKPGKKMLQKMIFLIKYRNVNLGYDYGLHFYGPYSQSLDQETLLLSTDGVIKIDFMANSHLMSINDEEFDVEPEGLDCMKVEAIDEVIVRFKKYNPAKLELLTTAMYAFEHLQDKSRGSVIEGVKKIKGSKYQDSQIKEALDDFEYFGMLFSK